MERYLRNAWYVAAWAEEVTETLFYRMLMNERVLLYRDASGQVAAISNVCPHRFAQLHMGRKIGDTIECGYHGLRFDRTGACVFNPHGDGTIPPRAKVKAYPVEERHGAIWIWMGDLASATLETIQDYGYLVAPGYRTLTGYKLMRANYQLLLDNLMDASHTQFVHASLIASDTFFGTPPLASQGERSVDIIYHSLGGNVPDIYKKDLDPSVEKADHWIEFHWDAPAALVNRNGVVEAGRDRKFGSEKLGTHFVTPETDNTSHYFFAHARATKLDDREVDESIRRWQRIAFGDQDAPMLEGCQEVIGDCDIDSLQPAILASDGGITRVRRILKRLIKLEEQTEPQL